MKFEKRSKTLENTFSQKLVPAILYTELPRIRIGSEEIMEIVSIFQA